MVLLVLVVFYCLHTVCASYGDQSPFFQKCTEKCSILNCTEDGLHFNDAVLPVHLKLLQWTCEDECKYDCMWKTVDSFLKRNWRVPQFHGKWPFVRILGIQEPASVVFSLLNMYVHFAMFKRFKKHVRSDTPLYWLYHAFAAVCINAWIWSTVFHARDLPFTEFMDYTCAFSIILINCYCMVLRLLLGASKFVNIVITSFFLAFFINHVVYLSYGGFDYGYNMKVNLVVGAFNAVCWFGWCFWNRKQQPYLWKCVAYVTFTSLSIVLELFDFPPVLWTIDAHSIWHLSTALCTPFFYGFIIDDSKYLKKRKVLQKESHFE